MIDANLYNPSLDGYIQKYNNEDTFSLVEKSQSLKGNSIETRIGNKAKTISLDKQVYPGNTYKDKVVHKLVQDNKNLYEHIIILVPSIKQHKDVVLLSDVVNTSLLVVKRNVTRKEDIYNAIQFYSANQLPLAKTIVVK